MKLAVVLLAFVALAWAADTETVAEDFASAPQMVKAHVVQSVRVFLDPTNVVKAKTVKHLPSHANVDSEESSEETISGNVFETSNFEADQVLESDAESLEASSMEGDSEADAMRFRAGASAPIQKLKQQLTVKAAANGEVPDGLMLPTPPGTPTDANVDPLSPAALNAQGNDKSIVMDEAAQRASHLYIGYEDPIKLPDGTEIKKPVDTSGTIGTEAGTDFDYNKKIDKKKKCANGCQVSLPVMVGYRGVRETPAEKTRRVTVPGDRERHRAIHEDYKIEARHTWDKIKILGGRKHLAKATTKINKLRMKRKAYEDTALNREVNVPTHPSGLI